MNGSCESFSYFTGLRNILEKEHNVGFYGSLEEIIIYSLITTFIWIAFIGLLESQIISKTYYKYFSKKSTIRVSEMDDQVRREKEDVESCIRKIKGRTSNI